MGFIPPGGGGGGGGADRSTPTRDDKDLVALVTVNDGDKATNSTISNTPGNDSMVSVVINQGHESVGDGDKTKACYFSGDGGTTARLIQNIVSGDEMFWNESIAGYNLDATDLIDFIYDVLV